jgi:hypothetical protein
VSSRRARALSCRNICSSRSSGSRHAILPRVRGQTVTWNLGGLHPMLASPKASSTHSLARDRTGYRLAERCDVGRDPRAWRRGSLATP